MLLTITNRTTPATDLGYLLHKHPERTQNFPLAFGTAHVYYSIADAWICTAYLYVDVDSVGLVRGPAQTLFEYVNDRPYVASSFLSVAVAQVFTSALNGRCRQHPDLVGRPLDLEAAIPVVPCREGENLLNRLFSPLGYEVEAQRLESSTYYRLKLRQQVTLQSLLDHLYVLIPVLGACLRIRCHLEKPRLLGFTRRR